MAVLKMQRLGLCALKKNRKEILELLQRRGVLDIDTDAAEDEVFQRTDTSKERADFEKEIQLAEHALEILQRYVGGKEAGGSGKLPPHGGGPGDGAS